MGSYEDDLHRTLVQLLIDTGQKELAAAMIDGAVDQRTDHNGYPMAVVVDIPSSAYDLISGNELLKKSLVKAVNVLMIGRWERDPSDGVDITLRVKLLSGQKGWQQVARDMIINYKGNNQAAISKKIFRREGKELLTYNEVGYASQSEIRIAQELEQREMLFFPLAVGIRADTGEFYRDHREPDFLICDDGNWGILEVSYHPDRYEKDSEKDAWFKKSGILCIQHYTAERCYREPAKVVDEFLMILAKHKR